MTDYFAQAQHDAVQELASELLKTAGNVMSRQGADPRSSAIVAAGFALALRQAGDIDPLIPLTVGEMLVGKAK